MAAEQERQEIAAALRRRISDEHATFFIGFTIWPSDHRGWKQSLSERLSAARPVRRCVLDSPQSRDARVLIDVIECASAEDAIEELLDELQDNQLASLPSGPPNLGIASFVHPSDVPPAVFFAHSNLCIRVISFARQAVDVIPWAEQVRERLEQEPFADRRTMPLESEGTTARRGEERPLYYTLPWALGEDGYLRFQVEGATLLRRGGRLFVKAVRPGTVQIKAYALEPRRETYYGTLALPVE
jgi:hypothetical protein